MFFFSLFLELNFGLGWTHNSLIVIFVKIEVDWRRIVEVNVVLDVWTRHNIDVGTGVVNVYNIVNDVCLLLGMVRLAHVVVVGIVGFHIDVTALLQHARVILRHHTLW